MSKQNKETEKQLSFEEVINENTKLHEQLTNKNKDYIFQINTRLDEIDYDQQKKEYVLNEMFHELIKGQKESMTACRIYGTPTERVEVILGNKVDVSEGPQERSPQWMLYIDGALLLGGLFSLINGVGTLRDPDTTVGLVQIILNFLLGGLAMLVLTKYSPKPGKTKGMLKYILATVSVMFFWILMITLTLTALPDAFNPAVPGQIIIGIGVISLVVKWYVKKKLNIQGTLF